LFVSSFLTSNLSMSETLIRQWQTLQLIPRSPKSVSVTVLLNELCDRGYDITRRTIERDLLMLADSFSLEVDTSQRPQLWSWSADVLPLDLPRMSQSEALTLLMTKEHLKPIMPASTMTQMARYFGLAEQRISGHGDGQLQALGNAKSIAKSASKPLLPEANWRAKVRVLPSNQPLLMPEVNSDALAVVQEALLRDLQCELIYRKRDAGKADEYPIHPLGLVQRGFLLYLVCTIKTYTDIKLLAVHRIQSAKLSAHVAKAPLGFSLDAYIASGALGWNSASESIVLKARFAADTAVHLQETPLSKNQLMTDEPSGHVLVTASVQLTQQLVWWLLGFGDAVEVLEPLALRNQMRETVLRMAANYTA
jgi:predicted DNA-binding transcriptional regulator YafY